MKMFSAIVKEKNSGNVVFLRNKEYNRKSDFICDIRGNGYSVNPKKVKESGLFDYIMNHTDCNPWDWDLQKIPE